MPDLNQNFSIVVSHLTEMGFTIESSAEDLSRIILRIRKTPGEVIESRVRIEVCIKESLDRCTVTPYYQREMIRAQIGPLKWDNPTILNWMYLLDLYLVSGFFVETPWLEVMV